MKKRISYALWLAIAGLATVSIVNLPSCKKGDSSKPEVETGLSVTTSLIIHITDTTAISGGEVVNISDYPITAYGVCWGKTNAPTVDSSKTVDNEMSNGKFVSDLTKLTPNTVYYVRAYATNIIGTTYGMPMYLKTVASPTPTVKTGGASNVSINGATLIGHVYPVGKTMTISFEYGLTANYGQTVNANPLNVNTSSDVSAVLNGLTPNTLYHFRVKALGEATTLYGRDTTFRTLGDKPTASCTGMTAGANISDAVLNGIVNARFFTTTITFEYGLTSAYGNEVASTPTSVNGNQNIAVKATISGLALNTSYHYRIKATNQLGTTYSEDKIITSFALADVDGNFYHTVVIGTQTWLVENLKTTHYRNGDDIPNVTDMWQWRDQTTGAYCWYNNDINNKEPWGALYNWYTISDARGVCPEGYHIPSYDEWEMLKVFLNGGYVGDINVIGGYLKETGYTHWNAPNFGATNSTGFTAVAAGRRGDSFSNSALYFNDKGVTTEFWSNTSFGYGAWFSRLEFDIPSFSNGNGSSLNTGMSLRCLKD